MPRVYIRYASSNFFDADFSVGVLWKPPPVRNNNAVFKPARDYSIGTDLVVGRVDQYNVGGYCLLNRSRVVNRVANVGTVS